MRFEQEATALQKYEKEFEISPKKWHEEKQIHCRIHSRKIVKAVTSKA